MEKLLILDSTKTLDQSRILIEQEDAGSYSVFAYKRAEPENLYDWWFGSKEKMIAFLIRERMIKDETVLETAQIINSESADEKFWYKKS